ncbi:glycopeptide [Infundibulicybe gibba]|nr:glycopeptide [Infundibulicybe gibba]
MFKTVATALCIIATSGLVQAESHTVHFDNRCGFGTPTLIRGSSVLSTGGDFTINGPLLGARGYLQTGGCGFDGVGCTVIETTLRNPTSPGSGSSTDISLIPPLAFSVTTGFGYFNGCNGAGADCTNPQCPTAFFKPEDTHVQVPCQINDVSNVHQNLWPFLNQILGRPRDHILFVNGRVL